MTQKKRVMQRYRILRLGIERRNDGFTRADAATEVGCYELSTRILELEAEGVTFGRCMESSRNRYGDGVKFMRYTVLTVPAGLYRVVMGS